ncbi:hypothetical protein BC829DRAFT_385718 [Chytridium lagenaria]|nr:hypothetical protein BC829DRAFT_385718 [Chytridium lagenaria]
MKEILNPSEEERVSNFIKANLCSLIGSCAVYDPVATIECINQVAGSLGVTTPILHMLNAMSSAQKKIMAMSMASLLATGHREAFESGTAVFATISGVVADVMDLNLDTEKEKAYWHENSDTEFDESLEVSRRFHLDSIDPISSAPLVPFVKQKILDAQNAVGGPAQFQELVSRTVDSEVLQDFLKNL